MQEIVKLMNKAYSGTESRAWLVKEQMKCFFTEGVRDPGVRLTIMRNEAPIVVIGYQRINRE